MREIELIVGGLIKPTPGKPVCLGLAISNQEMARKNGMKIIWSALIFENNLESFILNYFVEKKERKILFRDHILSSDSFTFASKHKVVIAIIDDQKLLEENDKNEFQKCSKRIMVIRNAFAHGKIIEESEGTFIEYFRGKLEKEKLDDPYWNDVEQNFKKTFDLFKKIQDNAASSMS